MKKLIIVVVVVLLAVGGFFAFRGSSGQQVATGDTIDLVSKFYGDWLKAGAASAIPSRATLAATPTLSPALRTRLAEAVKANTTPDPVLCQAQAPSGITTRTLFEQPDKAQIIVEPKGGSVSSVALVTLLRKDLGWYISDITCSQGDVAPPASEFTFEEVGYLIKNSVPKPYNPKNWHLVYEYQGKPGNVVPLLFDSSSKCTSLQGTVATCKPDQFTEATKVSVHGDLTERGVSVKKLEFSK